MRARADLRFAGEDSLTRREFCISIARRGRYANSHDRFLYSALTAAATDLGAVPVILSKAIPARLMSLAGALASGLLLAATFQLIDKGRPTTQQRQSSELLWGWFQFLKPICDSSEKTI